MLVQGLLNPTQVQGLLNPTQVQGLLNPTQVRRCGQCLELLLMLMLCRMTLRFQPLKLWAYYSWP
jgi:hypothetical protein